MSKKYTIPAITSALILLPFLLIAIPQILGFSQTYIVTSGSMEPQIPTGSLIWVENTDNPEEIEENDIITFQKNRETPITHRVIEVNDTGAETRFITKGDANARADPGTVRPEQVIGEVRFTAPYLGHAINWLGSLPGLFLLVVLPAIAILAIETNKALEDI